MIGNRIIGTPITKDNRVRSTVYFVRLLSKFNMRAVRSGLYDGEWSGSILEWRRKMWGRQ